MIAVRKLQGIFEEFAPHQVKQSTVYAMQEGLSSTPNMANRCLSVLRLVFTYAVKHGIVDSNPCTGVYRLREKRRDRLIEHEEFFKIRAKAALRLQLMMDIAYLTGQRIMDVATLPRSAIREEGVYFRQEKTDAKLLVAWTPELRAAIEQAKAVGGKVNGMTLFRTRLGGAPAYRTVRDQWDAACAKAGIADTTMRDIRAMSATNAKKQGKDATALLGHASTAMTSRYLRDRETPVVHGPSFGQSN
jgi:integrase